MTWTDKDRTTEECEKCVCDGIGWSEDGVWLCEDCLFEQYTGEEE